MLKNIKGVFFSDHPVETELIRAWAEAIEVSTNGQLTVTSYPDEILLKSEEIYDGVVINIAELGISCFA
ncbi:MAG: hypothetical protein Q7J85_13830 [Bacillota bacterium]|nr:hypothetical protein [Bacillota bacterium]